MSNIQDIIAALNNAANAELENTSLRIAVDELRSKVDTLEKHNQALELNLKDRSTSIDELEAKVRSLEVERDNSAFRTLELEDAFSKISAAIAAVTKAPITPPVVVNPPTDSTTEAPTPTPTPQGEYVGKRYSQLNADYSRYSHGFPNIAQWQDGGGTEEDYWR